VIVWNDPINLMSYVTFVFQKLFGYSREKATKLMLQVHNEGRAVVSGGTREKAEHDVAFHHVLPRQNAVALDGAQRKYLDEVGTMNIMLRLGDEVVTPPLTGTILPGVTRDSALTLMREWGLKVSERQIAIDDVMAAAGKGTLREAWGTGTAAVISPVGELSYRGERLAINGGRIGELTQRLYQAIVDIQYARVPDTHGWTVEV